MALTRYMRADSRQVIGGSPDLSPLLGTWLNTNPVTDHICRMVILERGGRLIIHAYGADLPEPIDWGEIEATPYTSGKSLEAGGFHAAYDFGEIETHLASNQKLGILVIQSYTSFKDGSGRQSYFTREFFHRPTPTRK